MKKIVKTKTFIISYVIVLGIILYFVILNAVEKSKSNKDNDGHEPKPGPPIPTPSRETNCFTMDPYTTPTTK